MLEALSGAAQTLLQGVWQHARQLLPTFGSRVERRELYEALRREALHHRVSHYQDAFDQLWELLDAEDTGWIRPDTLAPPARDPGEEGSSSRVSVASGSQASNAPFGIYNNVPEESTRNLAYPEWRRRRERDRVEEEKMQETVQGEMIGGSLYRQRQGRREQEEAALAAISSRTVVPGIAERAMWHRKQDEELRPRF